jgi:hypothetical protein
MCEPVGIPMTFRQVANSNLALCSNPGSLAVSLVMFHSLDLTDNSNPSLARSSHSSVVPCVVLNLVASYLTPEFPRSLF